MRNGGGKGPSKRGSRTNRRRRGQGVCPGHQESESGENWRSGSRQYHDEIKERRSAKIGKERGSKGSSTTMELEKKEADLSREERSN